VVEVPASILVQLGVTAAGVLAVLDQFPLLTDAMIGAGAGVLVGKLLVYRLERRRGELPAPRVRQLEWTWTLMGMAVAVGLNALVEGLP
jgi:hypothetical protein